jgi:hypothetical protein
VRSGDGDDAAMVQPVVIGALCRDRDYADIKSVSLVSGVLVEQLSA